MNRFFSLFIVFAALIPCLAYADPVEVSSPDLRPIRIEADRPTGHLIIYANFRSHRVLVDGAELPEYLSDTGIEVVSNEIHEVVVKNDSGAEKKYQVSVNPGQVLALYVDLGSEKASKNSGAGRDKKKDRKKDNAKSGYLTVTAQSEAQVYVDGKLVSSKTPLKRHEVSTGSHTVRVYFFDQRKFSKSREIYVGKGISMSVNFSED